MGSGLHVAQTELATMQVTATVARVAIPSVCAKKGLVAVCPSWGPVYFAAKASAAASMVRRTSSGPWVTLKKAASNWEGGK